MTDYFNTKGFQQDFNTLIKSLLLISKKLEALNDTVQDLKQSMNEEKNDKLVTPPHT